jgi:hypothetical protein
MTASTASSVMAYRTPECRCDEHAMCPGPREIRLVSQQLHERPVMTLQCACGCHRGLGEFVGIED